MDGLRLVEAYGSESAYRARFTTIVKNIWDTMCRQTCRVQCEAYFTGVAFNINRGAKLVCCMRNGGRRKPGSRKGHTEASWGAENA